MDNLRIRTDSKGRTVVAIDLGTAARFDSGYIQPSYGRPVGAVQYAAAESRCGLAGNRRLAPSTDKYALGCLLFELFNRNLFFHALHACNRDLGPRLLAMSQLLLGPTEEKRIEQWHSALSQFGGGVTPVAIDGPGNSVPPGISALLNELLAGLWATTGSIDTTLNLSVPPSRSRQDSGNPMSSAAASDCRSARCSRTHPPAPRHGIDSSSDWYVRSSVSRRSFP